MDLNNDEYFTISWVKVWPNGDIDDGSIGTTQNVDYIPDFLNNIIRPLCKSVGFTDGTIDDYIKETWG